MYYTSFLFNLLHKVAKDSGQSHLNCRSENLEQVIFLPASLKLLGVDTSFGGLLLFEKIESDVAQDSQAFGSLIFANTATVFIQSDIQDPVQFVFDRPMLANHVQNSFGVTP